MAREAEQHGAGEILITSIDRDGTFEGYDIELVRAVSDAVTIPVIASGGAGNYEHMGEAVVEGGRVGGRGGEHLPLHGADAARGEEAT